MTQDSVKRYRDLRKRAVAEAEAIEKLIEPVIQAGRALGREWREVLVAGAGNFPSELTAAHSIEAGTWPTVQQIGQAVSSWHQLALDVQNAWLAVPTEEKPNLPPPVSRFGGR